MEEPADRFRAIEAAEMALLTGGVRHDPEAAGRLLHEDFEEIGRSGRYWSRDEILSSLAAEPAGETPRADEWRFVELAPGLVLVTYRLTLGAVRSRHSSLWDLSTGLPQLRFHQGTVVPSTD